MAFQISGGLLDACVLSVLENEDTYGYQLTITLVDALDISESTLYPVLRRLQKNDMLTTYDEPFQGRNRRYYKITPKGTEHLEMNRQEWSVYQEKINNVLIKSAEGSVRAVTGRPLSPDDHPLLPMLSKGGN
ncbi:MAG: PadR family transcriptional regulator [Epulopiscium sp. Nele67-Bin004]|nr:MAG: PadR family transcriptional regulator [Epulopiscium sp. Nele67-Bin004]